MATTRETILKRIENLRRNKLTHLDTHLPSSQQLKMDLEFSSSSRKFEREAEKRKAAALRAKQREERARAAAKKREEAREQEQQIARLEKLVSSSSCSSTGVYVHQLTQILCSYID